MTTVTGIIRDTEGNALDGLSVAIRYLRPIVGFDDGAAVQNTRLFTTDGSGEIVMAGLVPGQYEFTVSIPPTSVAGKASLIQSGKMTVLDTDNMTLEEALDENVEPITPSLLQQAIAARDAAQAAQTGAETAQGIAETARDDAEAARDGAETAEANASAIVGSGNGQFPNGTASSPSITFASDTNTGFFRPSANTLAASTNGSERLRITSSGNVGIGTSDPRGNFNVHTFGSLPSWSSLSSTIATFSRNGVSDVVISAGDDSLARLLFGRTSSIAPGRIVYDHSAEAFTFTTNGSDERLRITSSGNVGIGTSSPGSRLSVVGLPTSPSGLSEGDFWRDGNTVKVVT